MTEPFQPEPISPYTSPSHDKQATLLQPLTAALLECVTPAEVVATVVERGMTMLRARAGLVALVTGDGQALEIVRMSGYADDTQSKWQRIPVNGSYPLSDAVRNGVTIYVRNRAEWAEKYPSLAGAIQDFSQASVSLPLVARKQGFGAIHFSFDTARDYPDSDCEFLDELARQCALALDRALLLEAVQKEREDAETLRTQAEVSRARMEFLARASALLGESLQYRSTLHAITRLAVPSLCDWAAVDMINPADETGPLLSLAVAHVDPAEVEWVEKARARYPVHMGQTGQPVVEVISTGKTVFLADIPEAVLLAAAQDAEQLRLIRKLDLRSFICVPLTARGKTLGAVTFASTHGSGRVFTPETVELVEELGRRAAIAVDNARLYAQAQNEATERRVAEGRFKFMANSAPVLIWTSGPDAECDWFNNPWLLFTGRTMEQERGNGWAEGVHPDDLDECLKTYLTSFHARHPFTMEYRLKRFDGAYRWLLDTGVPVFDETGPSRTFKGFIGSCVDITDLKQGQMERERLLVELRDASVRQRRFLQEMLAGFTEGRLRLCFAESEMPASLLNQSEDIPLSEPTLRLFRKQVEAVANALHFAPDRLQDLLTASHEAAMNAVTHGGGGSARVFADPDKGTIQVRIIDHGPGIAEELIHRAVERGFTTGGFGQGFFLLQSCADRVFFLTGATGTTVVVEQERQSPEPKWLK